LIGFIFWFSPFQEGRKLNLRRRLYPLACKLYGLEAEPEAGKAKKILKIL